MVDTNVQQQEIATYFAAIVMANAKRKKIVRAQVSSPYQASGISETLSENESDLLI